MAGEVFTELAVAALSDETLESVGDKVEDVTKRFPFLRYTFFGPVLCRMGHLFPLVLLNHYLKHNLQEDSLARWK